MTDIERKLIEAALRGRKATMITAPEIAKKTNRPVSEVRAAAVLARARTRGIRASEPIYPTAEADKITALLKSSAQPSGKNKPAKMTDMAHIRDDLETAAAAAHTRELTYQALWGLYTDRTGRNLEDDLQALSDAEDELPRNQRIVQQAGVQNTMHQLTSSAIRSCGKKIGVRQ